RDLLLVGPSIGAGLEQHLRSNTSRQEKLYRPDAAGREGRFPPSSTQPPLLARRSGASFRPIPKIRHAEQRFLLLLTARDGARRRARVAAPLRAEAERAAAGRDAAARSPIRPPLREETWLTSRPTPDPDLRPPPLSLLTVAQPRRSASSPGTPRSS